MTTKDDVLAQLQALAHPKAREQAERFGIKAPFVYGIRLPKLRALAKDIGKNHVLAQELWDTGIVDARIVALFIDSPKQVTEAQTEAWARDFDNWGIVDGVCVHLFCRTPFAYDKAFAWSAREEEFIKRAGFVLMAGLAVHDKKAPDDSLAQFLPIIAREAGDERHFVKKAVNWALRQIGKRNKNLNALAIATGEAIHQQDSKAARWIASDALRELRSDAVQKRLVKK
jgi:3-methyladenine DNA glycosylase AlkD